MTKGVFSKDDTTFLKGIAILMIVMHNYLHWIPGFGLENEVGFVQENAGLFWEQLKSFEGQKIITAIFGFLGHYGVQIFITFSAYGLTIQYQKGIKSDKRFVLDKLKKIYLLLAFAILFCVAFFALISAPFEGKELLLKIFLLTSTLSSFFNNSLYAMLSGPFWFFALIIQVYVCFPLLYRLFIKFSKKTIGILFLSTYLVIYALYFVGESYTITLMDKTTHFVVFGNMIGHLPEVFLGIYLAKFKYKGFGKWITALALLFFIGSQCWEILFPFSFLSVSILLLACFRWIHAIPSKVLYQVIFYCGSISMMLFIVNGPLRYLPLFDVSPPTKFWYLFLFLVILFPLSHVLQKAYTWFSRKVL